MSRNSIPIQTNKARRRSIFDDHNEAKQERGDCTFNFPTEKSEVNYPPEYVEKIRTETHLWKTHIQRTLDEFYKLKAEKKESRQTTVNENVLSPEQYDVLASFNFDEYMRRVKNFSDRAAIIAHKIQYKSKNDIASKLLAVQSRLENDIMKKHSSDE